MDKMEEGYDTAGIYANPDRMKETSGDEPIYMPMSRQKLLEEELMLTRREVKELIQDRLADERRNEVSSGSFSQMCGFNRKMCFAVLAFMAVMLLLNSVEIGLQATSTHTSLDNETALFLQNATRKMKKMLKDVAKNYMTGGLGKRHVQFENNTQFDVVQ